MSVDDASSRLVRYVDGRLLADVSVKDRLTGLALDLAAPDELAVTALDVSNLDTQPYSIYTVFQKTATLFFGHNFCEC